MSKKVSPCTSLKSVFFSIITDKVPSSLKELVWCWHCGPMSTTVWHQRLLHSSVWTHNITETHLQRSDQQRRRLLKRLTVLDFRSWLIVITIKSTIFCFCLIFTSDSGRYSVKRKCSSFIYHPFVVSSKTLKYKNNVRICVKVHNKLCFRFLTSDC